MKALTRLAAIAVLLAIAVPPRRRGHREVQGLGQESRVRLSRHGAGKERLEVRFRATRTPRQFIALFWAKRDPDLKTPVNEYRDPVRAARGDRRQVRSRPGKVRGALTERGKALILIGQPKKINRKDVTVEMQPLAEGQPDSALSRAQRSSGTYRTIQWTFVYEKEQLAPWTGIEELRGDLRGRRGAGPRRASRTRGRSSPSRRRRPRSPSSTLTSRNRPSTRRRSRLEAEQKAAAAAGAEALKGPALTPAVRTELEGLSAKPEGGPVALLPISFRDGATRLMVQIDVPAAAVPAPEGAKLAVLARSKDGKDAARVEEAAELMKSKGDLYTGRSLIVDPGEYDVAVALLDASGAVLASGRRAVAVTPLPTEFASTPVVLAYNDLEADGKKADDPFVFSGRRFVVKPEAKYDAKDGLLYAIRVYNPSVDPATKTMFVKRSLKIKPKGGSARRRAGQPRPADARAGHEGEGGDRPRPRGRHRRREPRGLLPRRRVRADPPGRGRRGEEDAQGRRPPSRSPAR